MNLLDQTRASPAEDLALDEALLDAAEHDGAGESLRFWEPTAWFVVVGYANHLAREVDLSACERDAVSVLRRCSGGGAVLQGPGCLNYALVLDSQRDAQLQSVPDTNRHVLQRHREVFTALLGQPVLHDGQTDLAVARLKAPTEPADQPATRRKFSGNSQRRRKRFLLFHGTILLGLDLDRVERYLPLPSREPHYRQRRAHRDFLVNLPLTADAVRSALAQAWNATAPLTTVPETRVEDLVRSQYGQDAWNQKF